MAKTRRPGELPPLPQAAAPAEVNPPPAAPATPTPPAGAPAPAMAPVAPGTSPVPAASASGALRARGSAPADPLLGTLIGERYRLIERIGSGGMAAVYRGEHDLLKKPVAVKLLLPELAVDQEMAARFEREAIAAARLDHPNCVAITDFGRTPRGQLFLVMEFLDGRPLSEASGYGKRLPWERAVEVGRQILRGLARAHEMGIVHRDLKASNIMIVVREGGRDVAKIIDFGIAKIFDGTNAGPHVETKAGIVFGTADFLAPERLLGKGDADPRSDLYSVGIILYEMCTGTRPFHTEDPYEIVRRALVEPPALPSTACPEAQIPRELEGVILKALEKEPERRYASAREFLQALDPIGRRAQSTTGYLTGKAPERVSPLASLATSGPERPGESLSDQFFAQEPAADDSSRVGGALAASQSLYPPLPGARPGRAAVWLWGGLVTTSVVLIGLAIMYSMGGKSDKPLDPGAQVLGPGPGGAAVIAAVASPAAPRRHSLSFRALAFAIADKAAGSFSF